MLKRRDYEHHFTNQGAQGSCRIRVYQNGGRPVVIATQERAPSGASYSSIIGAAEVIAADLIADGTLPEFHVSYEIRTQAVQARSAKPIADVAPFVFVEEYLEPEHRLRLLWFDSYEVRTYIMGGRTQGQIGNPSHQETNRAEVEALIGASLDEDAAAPPAISEEIQERLRTEIESYFRAYYSALRDLTAAYHEHAEDTEPRRGSHGFADTGSVPDFYRGAKDVRTFFCNDGVVVAHCPARNRQQDAYTFEDRSWATVQGAIKAATPPFPNGDRAGIMSYEPGEGFGAKSIAGPISVWDPGPEGIPANYSTDWTRLDWAHKDNLDCWRDPSEARERAREDLSKYVEKA
jgi:hypothetical protein